MCDHKNKARTERDISKTKTEVKIFCCDCGAVISVVTVSNGKSECDKDS